MLDKSRGQRIVAIMKERGISRDELAMSSGYAAGTISAIRSGKDFNTDQLTVLCEILEVTPNYIMTGENYSEQISLVASELHKLSNDELTSSLQQVITLFKKM